MRDYLAFKRSAVRYWERRRIFYNLALVPPSLVTYLVGAGIISAGDPEAHVWYVALLFGLSGLGANICYTFAYALEFVFGKDEPSSKWLRFGRPLVFASGTVLAVVLAIIGGRNIAVMEYYHR